jgi:hypothetical protein
VDEGNVVRHRQVEKAEEAEKADEQKTNAARSLSHEEALRNSNGWGSCAEYIGREMPMTGFAGHEWPSKGLRGGPLPGTSSLIPERAAYAMIYFSHHQAFFSFLSAGLPL